MSNHMYEENVPRYCKKCGAELPSTDKSKLCINCRRKKGETIRNAVLTVAAFAGTIAAVISRKELFNDTTPDIDDDDNNEQI